MTGTVSVNTERDGDTPNTCLRDRSIVPEKLHELRDVLQVKQSTQAIDAANLAFLELCSA